MQDSYINKIKDFKIVPGRFKNDEGEMQDYLSIRIVVMSDGQPEELNLSGRTPTKPSALKLALRGADDVRKQTPTNFLNENED